MFNIKIDINNINNINSYIIMNQIILLVLILNVMYYIYGYKYISSYEWAIIRKKLLDRNINSGEILKIKKNIFNKYKHRTYNKAKKFKLSNKQVTSNIKITDLRTYALNGLLESIDNFNPSNTTSFALHSDKFINNKLAYCVYTLKYINNTNSQNHNTNSSNHNKINSNYYSPIYEWYIPYWNCINDELSPFIIKILKLKYTKNFDKFRSNQEIAQIMNCTENTVNRQIIESTNFVGEKIKNNNNFGYSIYMRKISKPNLIYTNNTI